LLDWLKPEHIALGLNEVVDELKKIGETEYLTIVMDLLTVYCDCSGTRRVFGLWSAKPKAAISCAMPPTLLLELLSHDRMAGGMSTTTGDCDDSPS